MNDKSLTSGCGKNVVMKKHLNKLFELVGYRVLKSSPLLFHGRSLGNLYGAAPWIRLWVELSERQREYIQNLLVDSKAQLGQDLFAALMRTESHPSGCGFFVEIGASDGIRYSNTWLLEKRLGWNGILVEPCRHWHQTLQDTRTSKIDFRAVYSESGKNLEFLDVSHENGYAELSSIKETSRRDKLARVRNANPKEYTVKTVTLNDLLTEYQAPPEIDFISIDTEGSELEILSSVDFNRFSFGSLCIEHNYNVKMRQEIFLLLTMNGYKRVFVESSAWDDWYIRA